MSVASDIPFSRWREKVPQADEGGALKALVRVVSANMPPSPRPSPTSGRGSQSR